MQKLGHKSIFWYPKLRGFIKDLAALKFSLSFFPLGKMLLAHSIILS